MANSKTFGNFVHPELADLVAARIRRKEASRKLAWKLNLLPCRDCRTFDISCGVCRIVNARKLK